MKNIGLFIFICICISSFSQIKDTRRYSDYNFYEHNDTCIFRYTPTIVLTADTEVYYPKAFEIKLPNLVKHFETENNQFFSFFLHNNQMIFVDTDLHDNKYYYPDTLYIPSIKELEALSEYQYSYSRYSKNWEKVKTTIGKYRKKGRAKDRKDMVLIRDKCKILLFNIKRENVEMLLYFAETFRQLPSSEKKPSSFD